MHTTPRSALQLFVGLAGEETRTLPAFAHRMQSGMKIRTIVAAVTGTIRRLGSASGRSERRGPPGGVNRISARSIIPYLRPRTSDAKSYYRQNQQKQMTALLKFGASSKWFAHTTTGFVPRTVLVAALRPLREQPAQLHGTAGPGPGMQCQT